MDNHDFGDIPPERREIVQKQAAKWFAILLTSGLVMGGILAFGVFKVIEHFGLAQKPDQPSLRIELNRGNK